MLNVIMITIVLRLLYIILLLLSLLSAIWNPNFWKTFIGVGVIGFFVLWINNYILITYRNKLK